MNIPKYIKLKNAFKFLNNNANFTLFIDSKVKKESKYKDDYETFISKLKQNGYQPREQINKNNVQEDLINKIHNDNANGNTVKNQDLLDLNKEDYLSDKKISKVLNENEVENWDQFDANKEKFNVETNYDEVLYTTKLEKDKLTEEEKERAERIERVIN